MTLQIPDTCTFEGRRWAIEHWDGNHTRVPVNEDLGIRTVSPHTANGSGRIDHFVIWNQQLYLFKVEVNLEDLYQVQLSERVRREVLVRYEPLNYFDRDGERTAIREYRFEFLIFDDLAIPFSGILHLSGPYFEDWDVPGIALEHVPETTGALLIFEAGKVVSFREFDDSCEGEDEAYER